jgi:hypothetical protein
MIAPWPAKDREAMNKSGLKKYAMPHMHQAARMRMYDRVDTASATLRQLRELMIEPADSTMHSMDARFEATTKEAADTAATIHANGTKACEDSARTGLTGLTQAAAALVTATAAYTAVANQNTAAALTAAKAAHDKAGQDYNDAHDEATAWLAERDARALKMRHDAMEQVRNINGHL